MATQNSKTPAGQVKARVLAACQHGRPNDLVIVSADEAKSGVLGGTLDTDEAAVAYAEKLAAEAAPAAE